MGLLPVEKGKVSGQEMITQGDRARACHRSLGIAWFSIAADIEPPAVFSSEAIAKENNFIISSEEA